MRCESERTKFKAYGYEWPCYNRTRKCVWCGALFGSQRGWEKSKEHIVPKSHTPVNGSERISAAHVICNSVRSSDIRWVPYYADETLRPDSQRSWLRKMSEVVVNYG